MNIPTLMVRLAALQGHPIPISSRPAPMDAERSELVPADATGQIGLVGRVRTRRNIVFARFDAGRGRRSTLRLDLLLPSPDGVRPLIVYVPGGGFIQSVKAAASRTRRYVAARGFVVASIQYRTTRDGATWRDGVDDVRAAVRYLRAHCEEYGIDPGRVALWGESAGGYLAARAGVTSADPPLEPDGSAAVTSVVDAFGASDLARVAEGFDDRASAMMLAPDGAIARYVLGAGGGRLADHPDEVREADPAAYASATSPAFLLLHGSDDRIISPLQTAHLHRALLDAGASSRRCLVEGAGHGDIAVKRGEEKYWTTTAMLDRIVDFLTRTLAASARE